MDSFERNDSLPLDLLDTDGFFSTEQLGVSELDMAGLSDLVSLETRLGVPEPETDWETGGDVNLNCADPPVSPLVILTSSWRTLRPTPAKTAWTKTFRRCSPSGRVTSCP